MNSKAGLLLALLLLQGVFLGLGLKPMDKTQEVRVAETAREMVETGDWLIPRLNGEVRLRKPPLAYWLTATSYSAFGAVNEFTARFASALFAALTVLVIFFWARKTLGSENALTISACLVSSYLTLRYFRSAETDAILLFFVTVACVIAYQFLFESPARARVMPLYASMGLGFLTKGPAAVVIPVALLAALAIWKKRAKPLRKLIDPAGIAIFLFFAFAWYAAIFLRLPDAVSYWVAEELDASFITGKHQEPFFWYFYSVFSFFLPWSLFIIPAAIWLYQTRPLPAAVEFALAWFLLTLLVLSLNPSKQIQYALLLAPSLMILIGHYLAASEGGYRRFNTIVLAIVVVGAIALVGAQIVKWRAVGSLSAIPLAALVIGAAFPWLAAKVARLPVATGALLVAGITSAGWVYAQRYAHLEPGGRAEMKQFAAEIESYSPLFVYGKSNPKVSFYLQRVIPAVKDEEELASALQKTPVIYLLIEEGAPNVPVETVTTRGALKLWKIERGR